MMLLQPSLVLSTLLVSALSSAAPQDQPKARREGSPDHVHGNKEAFQRLLDVADETTLHSALHEWSTKFRDGIFSHDRTALEAVHSENAPLATSLLQLAKRQEAGSSDNVTVSPPTSTSESASASSPLSTEASSSPPPEPTTVDSSTPTPEPTTADSSTPPPEPTTDNTSSPPPEPTTEITSPSPSPTPEPTSGDTSPTTDSPPAPPPTDGAVPVRTTATRSPITITRTRTPTVSTPDSATAITTDANSDVVFSVSDSNTLTTAAPANPNNGGSNNDQQQQQPESQGQSVDEQVISFAPTSSTVLSTVTLPDGDISVSTSYTIVDAAVTTADGVGGSPATTESSGDGAADDPSLQNLGAVTATRGIWKEMVAAIGGAVVVAMAL